MAAFQRNSPSDRDSEQAITTLKKGMYLLKYGRRGKPKFCPFRLSDDEKSLIWYSDQEEKRLMLSHVSKIVPGQRTAVFKRYPQPDKEYQSFSLIYSNRSLDLICKDRDEAEVWFTALRVLILGRDDHRPGSDTTSDSTSESQCSYTQRNSISKVSSASSDNIYKDPRDIQTPSLPYESSPQRRLGKAFSEVVTYTSTTKSLTQTQSVVKHFSSLSLGGLDNQQGRSSAVDSFRCSLSSAVSSSSHRSSFEGFDAIGDVFIWGEGAGNGLLGRSVHRTETNSVATTDALSPNALESTVLLDAHNISCGNKHAVLVTRQGQIFSWGEGSGGRLGHGVEADVSQPMLISALSESAIGFVACGDFHTCAVTLSGDLFTWGDGSLNLGLLGHDTEVSKLTPKKVSGEMEGMQVSYISCGPWHTAAVTSVGKLFTFGDGTFGALGHGDRSSTIMPREVDALRGLKTLRASCGIWHTAAIVEVPAETSGGISPGRLFTWGDGEKCQLGHGDKEPRLVPSCVALSDTTSFSQVACGHSITVALTNTGKVYAMGSFDHGQLGSSVSSKLPTCVKGNIKYSQVEEIACGSHHIAVRTSDAKIYTWGKGVNGQLGHGDNTDRNLPTLVEALKNKQVKRVACGSNFTAAICLHDWALGADHFNCSGCRIPFSFIRKRHNCYNCGLVFCSACSSKKSLKAALAPNMNKPHRVCDDCFTKLNRKKEPKSTPEFTKNLRESIHQNGNELPEKDTSNSKSYHKLGRLSSFDSFKQKRSRNSKDDRRVSNETAQSELGSSMRKSAPSLSSRMVSGGSSPTSRKSSPLYSITRNSIHTYIATPEFLLDDSKSSVESLTQEIGILRAQVEDLTVKSQVLEEKLERTSRRLKEATDIAHEEAEKNKASKEVIRSLTAQDRLIKVGSETSGETSGESVPERIPKYKSSYYSIMG
ncbi:Zinc finger, FYVE-type [Corchorus olitorius]|uniref:Zinc finger, FYVE-type n=1 Tax=Corchorus olitorius TaxID=93759 RepID=A0A1R3I984_9ROSI|nr:Zinc finger, FYVE-type [Corchorus olitorius]